MYVYLYKNKLFFIQWKDTIKIFSFIQMNRGKAGYFLIQFFENQKFK